jgi:ABC-type sugar transport system substrate-binding protein
MDNNSDMRRMLAEGKNLISTTAHLPKEVGKAAVDTAMKILKHQPYLKEVLLSFQLDTQDSVKYDPGWGGQYKPSFSSYLWPEQLGALGTK